LSECGACSNLTIEASFSIRTVRVVSFAFLRQTCRHLTYTWHTSTGNTMSISDGTFEPVSAARKMISCSAAATSSSSNAQLRKVSLPYFSQLIFGVLPMNTNCSFPARLPRRLVHDHGRPAHRARCFGNLCRVRFIFRFIFAYSDGKPRVLSHLFTIAGTNPYS